jgi:hypothetical protein
MSAVWRFFLFILLISHALYISVFFILLISHALYIVCAHESRQCLYLVITFLKAKASMIIIFMRVKTGINIMFPEKMHDTTITD